MSSNAKEPTAYSPIFRKDSSEQENRKTSKTTDIVNIEIAQLQPFPKHPFKLYEGKRLEDLVESIKQMGIMQPIHVRPIAEEKYEILAGHNRVHAAKEIGLDTAPAIVLENMTDEDAKIFVVDSNFNQRSSSEMKPSELAKSLYMLNEAMKKKSGHRSDKEDGSQTDNRFRTMSLIGKKHNLSQATIARYIRIAHLIEELQERLDNKEIGIGVASHLSYLNKLEQEIIEKLLGEGLTIDLQRAGMLHKNAESKKDEPLTEEELRNILEIQKVNSKVKSVKLSSDFLSSFFSDGQSAEDIQDTISKALEQYLSK